MYGQMDGRTNGYVDLGVFMYYKVTEYVRVWTYQVTNLYNKWGSTVLQISVSLFQYSEARFEEITSHYEIMSVAVIPCLFFYFLFFPQIFS